MTASLLIALPGAADAAAKRFTVTLKAKPWPTFPVLTCEGRPTGDLLRLTGTVSPVRPGKQVRVYKRLDGGRWQIEGYARVRSSGRFTFIDRPTTIVDRSYKVRMPTTGSYRFAYSDPVRILTYQDSCPD
ncbi:hypothetical protein [Aeromicrobium wangtongii]|uniref:Uncharacterized protein n=1 Tax=Aeromicrobium wangtongii TaxID=2969247 RepID=A0ABY5M868_9ACTN|nr:hypothetical protein [Aeromicrobium wangtongii]MCD9198821.1 hypothetical protein [Aeromicrobium wangtongii]UUP13139.1 hypothetical protein NQV15_14935 [Aeromicrobium wangtongii]